MLESIKQYKRKLSIFWKMSFRYKVFLILNFLLCGLARLAINIIPLPRLSAYFGDFYKTTTISILIPKKQIFQAVRIGKSIRLASKYTPWDSSCLTQAMVAKFWCRLFKISYVFYIGVAKSADEPSGYKAHAWITAGPVAITGGNGLLDYKVVSSYVYFFKSTL